jgi:hypothetical protein
MTVNPQLGPTTELITCKGLIIHCWMFFIILTIWCEFYHGRGPWIHVPGLFSRDSKTVNPQLGPTTELTTCKGLTIHYKVFFIILTI